MTVPILLYNQVLLLNSSYFEKFIPDIALEYNEDNWIFGNIVFNVISLSLKKQEATKYVIGNFTLNPHTNCCGSVFLSRIASYSSNYPHLPKRGGHIVMAAALRACELGMYSSVECIIPHYSPSWDKCAHIAEKLGFKELKDYEVYNNRSGNTLRMFQRKIIYPNRYYATTQDSSVIFKEGWDKPTFRKEVNK